MEAEQLLANPLVREAFYALEVDLTNQLAHVPLSDVAGHTRLVLAYQTQRAFARHFWKLIQDGHAAGEEMRLRGRRID